MTYRPYSLKGNGHIVHNGTFYYYNAAEEAIVALHLDTGRSAKLLVPANAQNEGRSGEMLAP